MSRKQVSLEEKEQRRIQKNLKISESLKARAHPNVKKICQHCGKEFEAVWMKRNSRKYCSKDCSYKSMATNENFRKKLSEARIKAIENGTINGYGIHCTYDFNGTPIRCDSKLEYFALMNLRKQYDVLSIERNTKIKVKYQNCQGRTSTFIPDFIVKTVDSSFLVEVKSSNLAPFLGKRWQHYIENARIKRRVLDVVAEENGLLPLWITNSTYKGYNVFKLN